MKKNVTLWVLMITAALATAGGYWLGQRGGSGGAEPVATGSAPATRPAPKLLYYRNPMGLADTSPTPKKDPMGMDYVPVFEGEAPDAGDAGLALKVSPEKVQKLGVRTALATRQRLARKLSLAGRVEADERRIYTVAPKFEGFVEKLLVNATGQPVLKGQTLFEAYSPELMSAQREYLSAREGASALAGASSEAQAGMRELINASLARLRNWDIGAEDIARLEQGAAARRGLHFTAPVSGIVTEKKALQGMRFLPGEVLFQITDFSQVWIIAEVFERDLAAVQKGSRVTVRLEAYPERVFEGRVSYLYPTLNASTRTVPLRVELANPEGLLKPGMFARVEIAAKLEEAAITVPTSSVIDSGRRQVVLVDLGEGRFEPREVKLGTRSEEAVEVLSGVREGERVVVAANFLLDAESNLKAALAGFSTASAASAPAKAEANATTAGHLAEGRIEAIDAKAGTLSIAHGPVLDLNWPAMTMDFALANTALLNGLTPSMPVAFEFVERHSGEWVIVKITPRGNTPARPGP